MRGFFLTVKRNSWDLGAHHSGSRLLLRPAPGDPFLSEQPWQSVR